MAAEPSAVEQAVSRTLRDNLEKIQRTADELHQAVNDMVAACASSRASNALPSMVRAQTSAASLSATLEVLSRFVTSALQPPIRVPFEPEPFQVPKLSAPPVPSIELPAPALPVIAAEQPLPVPQPPPVIAVEHPLPAPPHPNEEDDSWAAPAPAVPAPPAPEFLPPVEQIPAVPGIQSSAEAPVEAPEFSEPASAVEIPEAVELVPAIEPVFFNDPAPVSLHEPAPGMDLDLDLPVETHPEVEAKAAVEPVEAAPVFKLDSLPPEEQELHRRAYRVAKVSMQDIRMLRPEDVRLGRQNKDLCFRLRDDIEKAHKEYDRRFQSIQSHPVDYFYDWMVEILAGGDPQALGEYPYPSPVLRR